jgi:hypothetical protein
MESSEDEEILTLKFPIKGAPSLLKREAGCVPLSYKAEDEAIRILIKMGKQECSMVDIYKAMDAGAKKFGETIDTETLKRTIPYSQVILKELRKGGFE